MLAIALGAVAPASALPPGTLARIDVTPGIGATLPLHARFRDERGAAVELGDYFGARPAIVVLGYYGCSNLCSVVLHAVRRAIGDAGLQTGRDAEVIVISIAPQETPAMAEAKARDILGTPGARGWHFLTGEPPAIDAVTAALGYRYAWDARAGQYAHGAGITLVDPQGRVRGTLPGVAYDAASLQRMIGGTAPVEASHVPWLLCFGYDPQTGRYTRAATTAARATGLGALFALAGVVLVAHRRTRPK
jgi:protein SCO1/2